MENKKLFVDFFDRKGQWRFAIEAKGGKVPAGQIVGKGWTVSLSFREIPDIFPCPDCGRESLDSHCDCLCEHSFVCKTGIFASK